MYHGTVRLDFIYGTVGGPLYMGQRWISILRDAAHWIIWDRGGYIGGYVSYIRIYYILYILDSRWTFIYGTDVDIWSTVYAVHYI